MHQTGMVSGDSHPIWYHIAHIYRALTLHRQETRTLNSVSIPVGFQLGTPKVNIWANLLRINWRYPRLVCTIGTIDRPRGVRPPCSYMTRIQCISVDGLIDIFTNMTCVDDASCLEFLAHFKYHVRKLEIVQSVAIHLPSHINQTAILNALGQICVVPNKCSPYNCCITQKIITE